MEKEVGASQINRHKAANQPDAEAFVHLDLDDERD